MALRATSPLNPDHGSTSLPATITFVVEVVDRRAETPSERELALSLAAGNDLFFAGGTKSVTQKEMVGSEPTTVTFKKQKISGTGAGLSSFRVSLGDGAGKELVACFIRLD